VVHASVSTELKLVPGQPAIIRNCLNPRLNGQRVICEKFNADLNEWLVKGDRFPLNVGMSFGEEFLEGIALAPTLLSNGGCSPKLVPRKDRDLLKTKLEEACEVLFDCSKENVGEIVSNVHRHANAIIQEGTGLGSSGDCPFASSREVDLYYQFCLKVLGKWSSHSLGQDEQLDDAFFCLINDLCEILSFLDTDAVTLAEQVEKNIQLLQREALFPNWVLGELRKGENATRLCLVIGKKWQLEETDAFRKAAVSLEIIN